MSLDQTFPEVWGPEPYTDPLEVYGPIVGAHDVEGAIVEILQTWGGTYVNEVCRRAGLPPGTLPPIRSWRVSSDILALPEDQMPRVIVRSLSAQVVRRGGGASSHQQTWRWVLEVGVQTVTRSVKSANAASPQPRLVALMYATALRACLIQKRDQAKLLGMIDVEGERYTELDPSADRSTHLASVLLLAEVPNVAEWGRGPSSPFEPDDPDSPPGPEEPAWPAATDVDATVDKIPLGESLADYEEPPPPPVVLATRTGHAHVGGVDYAPLNCPILLSGHEFVAFPGGQPLDAYASPNSSGLSVDATAGSQITIVSVGGNFILFKDTGAPGPGNSGLDPIGTRYRNPGTHVVTMPAVGRLLIECASGMDSVTVSGPGMS